MVGRPCATACAGRPVTSTGRRVCEGMMASSIGIDSTVISDAPSVARARPRPPEPRAPGHWQDGLFERVTQAFALLVLVMLAAILVALGIGAVPALEKF